MNAQDQGVNRADKHVVQVSPNGFPPGTPANGAPASNTTPPSASDQARPQQDIEDMGTGTDGEVDVWAGRYSFKNFMLRAFLRVLLTVCWIAALLWLDDTAQYPGHVPWEWFVGITGLVVITYWVTLVWQILLARYSHFYRLTNRRIFVDSGLFRRRRDQVELLRVQDVFVKQQRLFDRLMNVGTVVIESSEERLPVHYLTGVSHPNRVMDQVWHQARKERDLRSVKVDEV